jgi:hypothetical protein
VSDFDLTKVLWRLGMSLGSRNLYAMVDGSTGRGGCDDPDKYNDVQIGTMDTHELATEVVTAHNARFASRQRHPSNHE